MARLAVVRVLEVGDEDDESNNGDQVDEESAISMLKERQSRGHLDGCDS